MLFSDKNIRSAFLRGIKEELNLDVINIKFIQFLPKSNFYIIKEYLDENMISNKEKVFLFVAKLRNNIKICTNCKKIKNVKWISWKKFVNEIEKYPYKFTKTVRFFIKNKELKNKLEKFMTDFANDNIEKKSNLTKHNVLYTSPKNNQDTIRYLQNIR